MYEGTFGGGATVFDFNNDGYEDVFITGGMNSDALYLNLGNGKFKDIYASSGLGKSNLYVTQGAASADVNRDGFRDLFITTITTTDGSNKIPRAENLLFINNGDSTFRDATKDYGLEDLNSFSTGVSFGDINADGFPRCFHRQLFSRIQGKTRYYKGCNYCKCQSNG
ncbi:VCBS repeat-containing protein [Maribacter litopenaei]|uniref:VCBS repeat-containing protein n=1 Tax=Maribacter litopenaei TaxID=2976127 RepID=A0ABY5YA12_9FLAO|nr:VCBS repeat-containing protein [Maribacter litopenaei]UWX55172.1 VCBS repeat-containing protein [Maribacter litopenaei]